METKEQQKETEGRIQAECFQWFNNTFPNLRGLMYHVPNGGKMSGSAGNRLKAMGVVAGVPDLEFHFWRRTFFLECKTPTGTIQKEQTAIHTILHEHGFRVFIFRSLQEFQTLVWAILEDKSTMYSHGMTKADFQYRNNVFNYLYDLKEGEVQVLTDIVTDANSDKFKGIVFEFMAEGFDKIEGFEILMTPDYLGFYKKSLTKPTDVFYNGSLTAEVPNE